MSIRLRLVWLEHFFAPFIGRPQREHLRVVDDAAAGVEQPGRDTDHVAKIIERGRVGWFSPQGDALGSEFDLACLGGALR